MKIFDVFPFGFEAELDLLEIRLHEMTELVDEFVIIEAGETYGGASKPFYLRNALREGRFTEFFPKIAHIELFKLEPDCTDRVTGRLREAYQRNMLLPYLKGEAALSDIIIFSDLDEIPRREAIEKALRRVEFEGVLRLKQRSYYYNVNRLVDYGHDFASRARMALFENVKACGSMYDFRMFRKDTEEFVVEDAGWHFSYFGNVRQIEEKVRALSPFLNEYKLFGGAQLVKDMVEGRDLHHRRCELPEVFAHQDSNDPSLPKYFLDNPERFKHFTEDYYKLVYEQLQRMSTNITDALKDR